MMLVGCSSSGGRSGNAILPHPDMAGPASPNPGDYADYAVYANSDSALYHIDPDTLQVTLVGPFAWPNGGSDQMTDIAIDQHGHMTGISYDKVYAVNKATAECIYLADLDRQFNGLSFVPASAVDANQNEVLVASALDGSLYQLDPMTGASTPIGSYGAGLGSSGDVVSVSGFGTVATVKQPAGGSDWLATLDTATGQATLVGPTGVTDIWGLGFWKDKIFGFTDGNQFVLIDPKTGSASMVQSGSVAWWGAGVTTVAPVVQ
jgi:hypothetical protein